MKTSESVARQIVHDIVARGLRTGDRLPTEAAMLGPYGVSRATLREALRLLDVQGLIHLKPGPGGGPVVGSVEPANLARTASLYFHLSSANYEQVMDAQGMMEPLCAAIAAAHPDRASAMASFTTSYRLEDIGTIEEFRTLTGGFHTTIYQLVANRVLSLLTQAVTHIVTHHVLATMDPIELRQSILDEHAELARAITAGDAEQASLLMAAHFEAQHRYCREQWPARLADLIEWR